jgi:hypothetical protein
MYCLSAPTVWEQLWLRKASIRWGCLHVSSGLLWPFLVLVEIPHVALPSMLVTVASCSVASCVLSSLRISVLCVADYRFSIHRYAIDWCWWFINKGGLLLRVQAFQLWHPSIRNNYSRCRRSSLVWMLACCPINARRCTITLYIEVLVWFHQFLGVIYVLYCYILSLNTFAWCFLMAINWCTADLSNLTSWYCNWCTADLSNLTSWYWPMTKLGCLAEHVSRFHPGTLQP